MKTIDLNEIQAAINNRSSQQLSEVQQPQRNGSQNDRDEGNRDQAIAQAWGVLINLYGHQFVSQYGATPNDVWIAALQGVTTDQLIAGTDKLATWRSPTGWPPNAGEFRDLCKPATVSPDGTNAQAYVEFTPERALSHDKRTAAERARDKFAADFERIFEEPLGSDAA